MSVQKFVIVSYGRTGSNYLVRSLNCHPEVSCFWEIFNFKDDARGQMFGYNCENSDDPFEYAQKYVWGNATLAEIRGYKVFYFHCADRHEFWQRIQDDPAIKIIHLTRKNLFLRYLSSERARATGIWHPSKSNKKKYHEMEVSLNINIRSLIRSIESLKSREKLFRRSVKKPILEVSYEGLACANDVESSFNYLGVKDIPQSFPFTFSRSAIHSGLIKIENDTEVFAALDSVGYSHWYDEFQLQN